MRCGKEKESTQQSALSIQPNPFLPPRTQRTLRAAGLSMINARIIELMKFSASSFALFAPFAVNRLGLSADC